MITILRETADLLGQLIRRDYGKDTFANVIAQIKAY